MRQDAEWRAEGAEAGEAGEAGERTSSPSPMRKLGFGDPSKRGILSSVKLAGCWCPFTSCNMELGFSNYYVLRFR